MEFANPNTAGKFKEEQQNMIYIYGIKNCEFCEKAVELAKKENITYNYIDMPTIAERKATGMKYNMRTAPIIVDREALIGGYTEFAEWVKSQ